MEKYVFYEGCQDVTVEQCVNFINESLTRWGEWPRMDRLRNAMKLLTNPMFRATLERNVVLPSKPFTVKLDVRNINRLAVVLTRLNTDGSEKRTPQNSKDLKALKALAVSGTEKAITRNYAAHEAYENVTDSIVVDGLPVGVYLLKVLADNKNMKPDYRLLYVTDMYIAHQKLPGNKLRVAALSGTTGQPVPGAKLYIKSRSGNERTVKCGADGEAVLDYINMDYSKMRVCTDTDNAMPYTSAYNYFSIYDADNDRTTASLFADRKYTAPDRPFMWRR